MSGQVINRFFNPPPQLDGTVISVDAPFDEPPDFDIAKTTFGCMVLFPVLPFIIALAIFLSFFRVNVLQWLGILHLFGFSRAPTQKQEPVRNFRIRDTNGTEHQIKMKGHLKVGNVSAGDRVTVWGKWKHGTLQLQRAFNHRTSSEVLLKKINWNRLLGIVMVIFAIFLILSSLSSC